MAEYYIFFLFQISCQKKKKRVTVLLTILLNHPILNLHCEAPKK